MNILLRILGSEPLAWQAALQQALPQARIRLWNEGDRGPADYALVWKAEAQVLKGRNDLNAVFNLGAGVDRLLALLHDDPAAVPANVPIYRLEDAGMAAQMIDYATYGVLHFMRRFDHYQRARQVGEWQPRAPVERACCTVGVLGLGELGAQVATALWQQGFAVRGFSHSAKQIEGVQTYASFNDPTALQSFLEDTRVLINLLPDTEQTRGLLNRHTFAQLPRGAFIINVARGSHIVDDDLLQALESGQVAGAMLDVFREEPLPAGHPFWSHARVVVTPHIAAQTLVAESVAQVAAKIIALEAGQPVTGQLDVQRGY